MNRRVRYLAEKGVSKSSKHPLLLYKLPGEPTKCYKYYHKRENLEYHAYVCLGCIEVQHKEGGVTVNSIRASKDYSRFLTNPENQGHVCTTFDYLTTGVQQIYRQVANEVALNGQKPSVARANLRKKVEEEFPESTADAILKLPKRKAVTKTLGLKRKAARSEDVNPSESVRKIVNNSHASIMIVLLIVITLL